MKGNKYGRTSAAYILFVLLGAVLPLHTACDGVLNYRNYTHTRPDENSLTGAWVPDEKTLTSMREEGGYNTSVSTKLVLHADGSYELSNMPDWWLTGVSSKAFRSEKGTWSLAPESGSGNWLLSLKAAGRSVEFNLLGQKPPYRLYADFGDVDANLSMMFIKQ